MRECRAPLHNESGLRCSHCGEIICPECAIQTPVGFRCRECAALSKLPTFQVGTKHYTIAVLVGLGLAAVASFLWSISVRLVPFFYFNFLIAPGIGAAVSEVMSRAVNRKRSIGLACIAGGVMVIAYLVVAFAPWGTGFYVYDIAAVILGVMAAASLLK